jgi:hypothetical protein
MHKSGLSEAGTGGAAANIVEWCAKNGVPCFVKDNLRNYWPGHEWPRELPEVTR